MIEVHVSIPTDDGPFEVALIRLERVASREREDYGDYVIHFAVNTGGDTVGVYQRSVDNFPRRQYNILGLLKIALETLDEKEFRLDGPVGYAGHSPDMARRLKRALQGL